MNLQAWGGEKLLRLLGSSWSLEWEGLDRLEAARRRSPRGNVIYALWHSSLLVLAYTHRRRDVQVLVSQHRDGELIARIVARMGYGLVRGSSRRGGVEALFRMATLLESGLDVAVTVDGPVGPRYCVQSGVVLLARRTGRPIVPIVATAARGLRLRTWDELRVPHPGTRLRILHGEAIDVDSGLAPSALLQPQHALETALREATRGEEARWGRSIDFEDVQDRRSYWERASEASAPPRPLRVLAAAHAAGLRVERRLRPRPHGKGTRPWVVGIGNLEAGGTGKTPCTLLLAQALRACGLEISVLLRGHGGSLGRRPAFLDRERWSQASDEARLLAAGLGEAVPVMVARRKPDGLEKLRRERPGLDVVLVDDAFQTPGLDVDRHLVLLDWEHPLGNGWLLPAGRLREPAAGLRRADALLFTRARGETLPQHPAWDGLRGSGRIFTARESIDSLHTPPGRRVLPETLRGRGVALLCGLGRPQAFERLVRALAACSGFTVRRAVRISDHAPLEPALRKLMGRLESLGCEHVLVTRKDVLRLPAPSEWNEPLLVVEQRLEIGDLARLLQLLVPGAHFASAKLAKLTESDA